LPDGARSEQSYEITLLKQLNGGTFARIYLAEATGGAITRLVAVKVLREQWVEVEEIVQRTQDEARMLAQLRHPNIVRVEGLVEFKGQPAIVMEFVEGLDGKALAETVWRSGRSLSPRAVWELGRRVSSALDAAWRKVPYGLEKPLRLVHRDIKPSNLMLSVNGELKILDFGTARANFDERQAHTRATRLGSLKYMSPERREGDRGLHPSDIYSLGLTLIELLGRQWLPVLPLRPNEHDRALADAIARIPDTGLGNGDWDQASRTLLGELCAYDEDDRPDAQAVAKILGAFTDESDGMSLEALAEEIVEPAVSQRRLDSAGDLEGQRLAIAVTRSSERPAKPAKPAPQRSEQATIRVPRAVQQGWDQDSDLTIQDAPQFPGLAAPAYGQPPIPGPPVPTGPARAPPPAFRQLPPGPSLAYSTAATVPHVAHNPKSNWLSIILAGLVGAFAVVVVLILLLVLMQDNTSGPAPAPAPIGPPPAPSTPERVAPAPTITASTTGLAIQLKTRRFQWVKVVSTGGELMLKGDRDGLSGWLPPGDYRVVFKRVGQTSSEGDFSLTEDELSWRCDAIEGKAIACFDESDESDEPVLVVGAD
jgi:serine/threonine protein kinase